MATRDAVNPGAKYCRFCGGPITQRGDFAWCENNPSVVCENMHRDTRKYCEHCGKANP